MIQMQQKLSADIFFLAELTQKTKNVAHYCLQKYMQLDLKM